MLNHVLDNVFDKIFSENAEHFFQFVPYIEPEQNLRGIQESRVQRICLVGGKSSEQSANLSRTQYRIS